jgi:hypothetical protein
MDAFAKSDDERDFYLDKLEGHLLYADPDKDKEELETFLKELSAHPDRFALLPKMTFYEVKKFMEGFVHEKVYDIDTKEKLLEIISQKEARENFLEFIYDHLTELEKWQVYYQERSRIRIIEWLRGLHREWAQGSDQNPSPFLFVFEEDLDLPRGIIEKVKRTHFDAKVPKDVQQARDALIFKANTYLSHEATHPKAKRGRPPKVVSKVETEVQISMDIYSTHFPSVCYPFLFHPDITSASALTFSSKFESEEHLLSSMRGSPRTKIDEKLEALSQRLESLRKMSSRFSDTERNLQLDRVTRPLFGVKKSVALDKKVEIIPEMNTPKIDDAISSVIPKKKGKGSGKEMADSIVVQTARRSGVRKVTQIKPSDEE